MLNEKITFWPFLRDSVIISGFISVVLVSAVVYLAVTGQPVPDVLTGALFTVVGFFFGSRKGHAEAEVRHMMDNHN